MEINYMFSRIDRDKGFNNNQKKYIKEDIKNNMSITFIASLFDEYERNDTQVKEIINVFKNIDINFKEVHLIDNRVSKEDAYKYIEKTDIVYLMGGSPQLEMKSIIEYNLFNILRNRDGMDEVFEVSKYTRIVGLPNESFIRIKDNDIEFVGKHYFIENGVME